MNTKTILAILGILAIGYVLGVLTAGIFVREKVEKVNRVMGGNHFEEMLIKNVHPTQEQLDKIRPIISNFEQEFKTTRRESREQMRTLVDSMHNNVKAELTEEQQILFEEQVKEMRKMMLKRKGKKGHPGERRPPRREHKEMNK